MIWEIVGIYLIKKHLNSFIHPMTWKIQIYWID